MCVCVNFFTYKNIHKRNEAKARTIIMQKKKTNWANSKKKKWYLLFNDRNVRNTGAINSRFKFRNKRIYNKKNYNITYTHIHRFL